nr:uncharacterized protein LOC122269624 [Parasteatoda tepidariorum]
MVVKSLTRFSSISINLLGNKCLHLYVSPSTRMVHLSTSVCPKFRGLFHSMCGKHIGKASRQTISKLRHFSTLSTHQHQTPPPVYVTATAPLSDIIDPFKLAEPDLLNLYSDIRKVFTIFSLVFNVSLL